MIENLQRTHSEGRLFIVSAPSGAGKTSLVRHLVKELDNIEVSISHTTRSKRPLEVDTVDYFFVNEEKFNAMIANHEFLEYAHVFGKLYGTSLLQINARLQPVGVFILPPSLETLHQRLLARQQDHQEVIAQRMQQARDEIKHYEFFDYIIVNDVFAQAANELISIVVAERLHTQRQEVQYKKLLSLLLGTQ